jgi:hypothetical protein
MLHTPCMPFVILNAMMGPGDAHAANQIEN